MKLYIVVVFDLKICMEEDNRDQSNIKGDNNLCGTRVFFVI